MSAVHRFTRFAWLIAVLACTAGPVLFAQQPFVATGQTADDIAATRSANETAAANSQALLDALAEESQHNADPIATGAAELCEAKDVDGATPPNVVVEGKMIRCSSTMAGARQVTVVNEAGTKELITPEDATHADADPGIAVWCRRIDAPASSASASGKYATLNCGPNGAAYVAPMATAGSGAGASTFYWPSAASTNSNNVKSTAGNVYLISALNTTSTLYYLRLYDAAAAPTCSSATGFIETIPVPASTSGAGVVRSSPVGKAFTSGIGFCLTGGASSTDNTNAATGVYVTVEYK
jgi:hypothetical protein